MRERLFLPPFLYGCTGIEMNLYFANVFTCINPGNYVFKFHCEIGRCDQERWRCIPRQEETGVHEARLEVISEDGVVAEGECRLVICSPDKASDRKLRLMMVGDSLTDQTWYPAHIHTLCRKYNIDLTMVGTNIPEQLRELPGQLIEYPDRELLYGVRHEGWGGWSAATFLYRKAPKGAKNGKKD